MSRDRLRLMLAFAWTLLAGTSSPADAQSPPAVIGGTVVSAPGQPVPGAIVRIEGQGLGYSARTDTRGVFALLVEPSDYAVEIVGTGGVSSRLHAVHAEPGRHLTMRVTLSPLSSDSTRPAEARSTVRPVDSIASVALQSPLLSSLPLPRADMLVSTLEAFSSVVDGSVLGAGAATATTSRVDGIDLTDPLNGRVWSSPIATIAEQFDLRLAGLPPAEGGFTGAVVDIVTRAGGDRLSGLFDARFTGEGLGDDNLTADLVTSNPLLADATRLRSAGDGSAWLGGPIRPHRAYFAGAFGLSSENVDSAGPRTDSRRTMPRVHGRLSVARARDVLTSAIVFEHVSASGLAADADARGVTDDTANRQTGRTLAGRLAWQRQLTGVLTARATYTLVDAVRETAPSSMVPGHMDVITGLYTGSQGRTHRSDRLRHLATGSVALTATAAGTHLVESGVDFEWSHVDELDHFVQDTFFVDVAGRPNSQIDWDGSDRRGRTRRFTAHVQDGWGLSSRLTINVGIRLDLLRGATPGLGTVYDATVIQPRAGANVDIAGDGRMLARAHYGEFGEPLWFTHYDRATPGVAPAITYALLPNGGRQEVERLTTPVYGVDRSLRQPRIRELAVGLERRLTSRLAVGVTGVVRDLHHVVDAVFPDARWIPLTRPGLDNTPITVYRWANRRDSEDIATIQNVDGVTYLGPTGVPIGDAAAGRRYRGLIVDVRGEGADGRWAFWAGWTSSRNEGTVDNTFDSSIGRSWLFASPSAALINTDGRATVTPTHKVSALATARIPWIGARVSAVYLGRTGHQYAAVRQFGNETLDFPQSEDGRQVLLEARGARRLDFDDTLDLRGEYAVALGGRRSITLYADVMNLMNRASVLEVSKLYPLSSAGGASIVRFEAPTRVREPRQLYIGGRFAF